MWDELAEVSVLGGMLTDEKCIAQVLDVLEPAGEGKFYKPSYGRVYATVRGSGIATVTRMCVLLAMSGRRGTG